jgi:ribosome recycling factor
MVNVLRVIANIKASRKQSCCIATWFALDLKKTGSGIAQAIADQNLSLKPYPSVGLL